MQSFQKLATVVALMLLASKEAVALPQPQVPNTASNSIGTVGNQIGVASGNISPSSVNAGNPGYYGPGYYPYYPGYYPPPTNYRRDTDIPINTYYWLTNTSPYIRRED